MSSLYEDITAQVWLTQAFGVLTLDDLWTRQLNAGHMTPDAMHDTAELGDALLDSWARLTDAGTLKELGHYLRHNAHRAAEAAREADHRVVPTDDADVRKRGVRIVAELERASANETAALHRKIQSLRASTWTSGDLSPQTRCLLLAASTIVAYTLGQVEVGSFLGGWFGLAGCPKLLMGTLGSGG
ncbi:hypothetical protein ACIQI8_27255 [Streptomyces sp. NPDC092369]|uniref:hypothetical protein n=1 Tax=Streptomyces sp. NPDC092369 TaxID=3366015 RepID=UPI003823353D